MLRGVALARADHAGQFADGKVCPVAQLDEDQEALWVGERLAELGVKTEDLLAPRFVRLFTPSYARVRISLYVTSARPVKPVFGRYSTMTVARMPSSAWPGTLQ